MKDVETTTPPSIYDETHSETMADEVAAIEEVPSTSKANANGKRGGHNDSRPRNKKSTLLVVAAVVIVAALAIALGVSLSKDDSSDNVPQEDGMSVGLALWIPIGEPIREDFNVGTEIPADLSFHDLDVTDDGSTLVVAGVVAPDFHARVDWYAWDDDASMWNLRSAWPLGDEETDSHPSVYVAGNTLVVSDKRTHVVDDNQDHGGQGTSIAVNSSLVDLQDSFLLEQLSSSPDYQGLIRIFSLTDEGTLSFVREILSDNHWTGTAVSLNADGTRMAVGAVLDDDKVIDGAIQVLEVRDGKRIGQVLHGADPIDTLGGIALSGDGMVVAAGLPLQYLSRTSTGYIRVWQWTNNRWDETAIAGPRTELGLGEAVMLSHDGTIVAATAFLSRQVLVFANQDGNWTQRGQALEGTQMDLSPDGDRIAVVSQLRDGVASTVQVYDWNAATERWQEFGQALSGTAVRLMTDRLVVHADNFQRSVQTWGLVQ